MELRPYQLEVARAVLDSIENRRGLTFSVEIARQGGKNELSAHIEVLLLTMFIALIPLSVEESLIIRYLPSIHQVLMVAFSVPPSTAISSISLPLAISEPTG